MARSAGDADGPRVGDGRGWRSPLLWGVIGALVFLVGVQGWALLGGNPPVGWLGRLGIAAGVAVVTTLLTRVTAQRIARKERS